MKSREVIVKKRLTIENGIKKLPKRGAFKEVVMVLVDGAPFVFHVDKMPVIALVGFIHRFI